MPSFRGFASGPSFRLRLIGAPMAGAPPEATFPVCVGLHSSELVLRGGSLKGPEVLSGLRVVDGKPFVYLQQSNTVLCRFLTGHPACFRPLAKTSVVEDLRRLRDEAYTQAMDELIAASMPVPEPAASVEDLGLEEATAGDDPKDAPPISQRWVRRRRQAFIKQLPRTATVNCLRPGAAPWPVTILLENGRGAPAMWATAANFDRLLELVRADIATGAYRRKPHPKSHAAEGRRAPRRNADGTKEYFIRGRWVAKKTEVGKDGKRRVKTLKRRPTDDHRSVPPAAPAQREELDTDLAL